MQRKGFISYLQDPEKISFPWTMIDKITPRPGDFVQKELQAEGVEDMEIVVTDRRTYIAPFVNAEGPQYLVIEDRFPNGRPELEKAGVYMTDRETVNKAERMKVTACLNPIHTALAPYGRLLKYEYFADLMEDPQLKTLARNLGYGEGLPKVVDPGIFSPKAFLDEVLTERMPISIWEIPMPGSVRIPSREWECALGKPSKPMLRSRERQNSWRLFPLAPCGMAEILLWN